VSNLKSVALTVLELLAFNAQKFRGSHDLGHAPFWENFWVMSGLSLGTRVSNLKSVALTVLELLAFNSHRSIAHRHTDRQTDTHTHIERTHYLRHSLRSLGGDNKYSIKSCNSYKSGSREAISTMRVIRSCQSVTQLTHARL